MCEGKEEEVYDDNSDVRKAEENSLRKERI